MGGFGRQWHQLDHMQTICPLLQTDNHTNTASVNYYGPGALPDAQPKCQSTEGNLYCMQKVMLFCVDRRWTFPSRFKRFYFIFHVFNVFGVFLSPSVFTDVVSTAVWTMELHIFRRASVCYADSWWEHVTVLRTDWRSYWRRTFSLTTWRSSLWPLSRSSNRSQRTPKYWWINWP